MCGKAGLKPESSTKVKNKKSTLPRHEIATILRQNWHWIDRSPRFSAHQKRMFGAMVKCRTEALGGHKKVCTKCGEVRISYNSCRNRNCPKCQTTNREKWIMSREAELLPVPYFHVVFTLPSALNRLALKQPVLVYNTLFRAAWATLNAFGNDPKHLGAQVGMTAVLHTWGQTLSLHPHLHCIVPGGGLVLKDGHFKLAKTEGKYLFPAKAMAKVFRAKYVAILRQSIDKQDIEIKDEYGLFQKMFKKDWVVYAKRPFAKPQNVVEYLGRYSHKIAISNHRIKEIKGKNVTFSYKDYRDDGAKKEMTLKQTEFIRRYSMHILPSGFQRIRHYGFLASCHKEKCLKMARKSLKTQGNILDFQPITKAEIQSKTWQTIAEERLNFHPNRCLNCGTNSLIVIETIAKKPMYLSDLARKAVENNENKERAPPSKHTKYGLLYDNRPPLNSLDNILF